MAEENVKKSNTLKDKLGIEGERSITPRFIATKGRELAVQYINILQWLPKYSKEDGICDIIAGITIGLTMLPQSIAYALLAGLSPEYGLYSSFMGTLIYVIFGTVKEVSIGPTSLMALLTFEFTRDLPIDFVVLLTFLSGCVELLFGILRLGVLVDFISAPVVSGFTTATSIVIAEAQMKGLLGIKYKSVGFIDNLWKLCSNIQNTKLGDAILGVASIIFLLIFREYIPEIFLRIAAKRQIQPGFPSFRPPPFSTTHKNETYYFGEMVTELRSGIFIIPVVSVLANVAIAKAYLRYEYFGRDFTAALVTFVVSLGISIEIGLLLGVAVNCSFLLYLWARPEINVDHRKVSSDHEYLLVTPDGGLFFPAIEFVRAEVCRIAVSEGGGVLPIVLNCSHLKGMDFSAAEGILNIQTEFRHRQQTLVLLNLKEEPLTLLGKRGKGMITHCSHEDELEGILFGDKEDALLENTIKLMEEEVNIPLLERKLVLEQADEKSDKKTVQ
ncbi:hypothetical protein J437_LFUL000193 [Ladona fulva]|uniref:STAS domain-containing protein n=1 Tax=Ladona fulva TaxID=123851 RepID=A0A8K0KC84_LADFU|nr:hypothetical protein J437_LFUL000193 [Ladona fulva]